MGWLAEKKGPASTLAPFANAWCIREGYGSKVGGHRLSRIRFVCSPESTPVAQEMQAPGVYLSTQSRNVPSCQVTWGVRVMLGLPVKRRRALPASNPIEE